MAKIRAEKDNLDERPCRETRTDLLSSQKLEQQKDIRIIMRKYFSIIAFS